MAEWRWMSVDLTSGQVRNEISVVNARWTRKQNVPGGSDIIMPLDTTDPADIVPWQTCVYGERNGVIVQECIVTAAKSDGTGRSIQVTGKSMHQYLYHRLIPVERFFPEGTPQTRIVESLINDYASDDGIGLVPVVIDEGIERQRTYRWWNFPYVGEMIENLTNVIGGPDVELVVTPTGLNTWERRFYIAERLTRDTNYVLEAGRNLSDYGLLIDGAALANRVTAVGSGEEQDMLTATAANVPSGYPRLDTTTSHKTVILQSTLDEHALSDLQDKTNVLRVPTLVMENPTNPPPGTFRPGDSMIVRIKDHWMDYEARSTILGWNHEYMQDGGEKITFEVTNETPEGAEEE